MFYIISFPISATNNDEVEISGDRTKEKKIDIEQVIRRKIRFSLQFC